MNVVIPDGAADLSSDLDRRYIVTQESRRPSCAWVSSTGGCQNASGLFLNLSKIRFCGVVSGELMGRIFADRLFLSFTS